MKAIFLSLAALFGATLAAPVDNKPAQLQFGDSCVAYAAKDGFWTVEVVDCKSAPEYTWNAGKARFEVTINSNTYCLPAQLNMCDAKPIAPSVPVKPQPPKPQPCTPLSCPSGQVFDKEWCRCVNKRPTPPPCQPKACLKTEYWNADRCKCVPLQTPPLNPQPCTGVKCGANQILNYDTCECITPSVGCRLQNTDCAVGFAVDVQQCQCVPIHQNRPVYPKPDCRDLGQCSKTQYWNADLCQCVALQMPPLNGGRCPGVTCRPNQILNYDDCKCITPGRPGDCPLQNTDCPKGFAVDVQQCKCVPASRG